jgi:hypothetical protein
LPIGAGVEATQFDGDIVASCRDGTRTIAREISQGKFAILQALTIKEGARTMGLDSTTHSLYLPTAEFGTEKDARSRPFSKPDSCMILEAKAAGK